MSRCRALARVLPASAAFTGITAAQLYGWWLPFGTDELPLHVIVRPEQLVSRPGVRCTRSMLSPENVGEHNGLPVTSGLCTMRLLAADWSLLDLVVMADSALRRRDIDRQDWALVAGLHGGRGIRRLRRAAELADPRSESAMETLLRLVLVLPGLPPPTPQAVLRDRDGGWLAQVDLLGADGKSVFEFDGANHDEPARHAKDVTRWRLLRREDYEVFPYTFRDIAFSSYQIVTDYQGALGLPKDPRAAQAWLREWERSSFSRKRKLRAE